MLSVQGLTVEYLKGVKTGSWFRNFLLPQKKPFRALEDVSFSVKEGEIFGLLGPNGAGKTTAIKAICGFLRPVSGRVLLNGKEVKSYHGLSDSVAFAFGRTMIYFRLTGYDNLKFYSKMLDIPNYNARVKELADFFGLTDWMDEYVESYSTGMKGKLALARALLKDPDLLFLDEPTQGMDALSAVEVRKKIKEMEKTVFLTTHYIEEADQLCDRIAILNRGKIIKIGTPTELKAAAKKKNATLLDAFVELIGGQK